MEIRKTKSGGTEAKFRGAWVRTDNQMLNSRSVNADINKAWAASPQGQAAAASNKATQARSFNANQGVVNDKPNQPPQPRPPQGPIQSSITGTVNKPLGESQVPTNLRTLTDGILGVNAPDMLDMPSFDGISQDIQDVEMPDSINLEEISINKTGVTGLGMESEQADATKGTAGLGTNAIDDLISGLRNTARRRVF
jgi:hypothetical protein